MIVALLHPQFLNRAERRLCRQQPVASRIGSLACSCKVVSWLGSACGPRIKERLLGVSAAGNANLEGTHKETCAEIQKTVVDYKEVAGSRSGMLPCRFDSLPQRNEDLPFHIIVGPR
jgi:hypothetical protein